MPAEFDFTHPPFDCLTKAERAKLSAAVDIVYAPAGDILLTADSAIDQLYVVIKGLIAEKQGDEVVTVHGEGDLVGGSALAGEQVALSWEIQEEALAYAVPRQMILDLCARNSTFEAFFSRSIGERLAARAAAETTRGMASFMVAKVEQAYLHPAIFIDATTTLRDAAVMMKDRKATSLLVRAAEGRIGVLTGTDLRDAAIVGEQPFSTPVSAIATFDPVTIAHDDFLLNAQVLMTRHGFRRLPVLQDGAVVGVLELTDLLAFLSSHSHLVATQVDRATSVDDLRAASEAIGPLLHGLHGSGVKIRYIAEMVTDLNRQIQRKLFEFLAPPELLANACLMVMGSEGRGEQIAKTDQDNAIILRDGANLDPAMVRDVCAAFTAALISFGYPPCPGNMMVSNPDWARTESDFRDAIYHWIMAPEEKSFLNLAAFIDAHAVAGDPSLLDGVRDYMNSRMTDNGGFLANFARPALSFETPIGLFHQIVVDKGAHKGEIDVKKGGLFPIVHGIRALALEKRLNTGTTLGRIQALAGTPVLGAAFAADLAEAFQFLMELRLHGRLDRGATSGSGADNYVRADDLTKLQRDALKDSLLIVKQFKQILTHHFHLSSF